MTKKECEKCNAGDLQDDFAFCPYCGVKLFESGRCGGCGHENGEGAKFCRECGITLTLQAKGESDKKVAFSDEKLGPHARSGITLEFGYSSSSNFDLAVEMARGFATFKKYNEGRKAIHRVDISPEEIAETTELADYIGGWKSSRVYMDGEKVTWKSIYGFSWCYGERESSYRPEHYCFGYEESHKFNLWGCVQARMPFTDYSGWLTYGRWVDNDGTWEFDKDRIRHKLQQKLYEYRFCPAFNEELVEDVLNTIPKTVNPRRSKDWKFLEDWSGDESSGGLVVVTVDHGYEEKTVMKGVKPTRQAIKHMIKQLKLRLPDSEIL